jgi:hypothetical protein
MFREAVLCLNFKSMPFFVDIVLDVDADDDKQDGEGDAQYISYGVILFL